MAWSPIFTVIIFYSLVFCSFSLGYLYYDIEDEVKERALRYNQISNRRTYDKKITIIDGLFFLNGAGCLVNKIFRRRCIWIHAILHTIVLFIIIYSREEVVNDAGNNKRIYIRYSWMVDLPSLVYIITYILAFHLVVIRYGLTKKHERLYCEVHAATGAISLITSGISCILYAYSQKLLIAPANKFNFLGLNYLICSVFSIWFLVLEPNFNWRHMATMFGMVRPKKYIRSKTPS